MNPILPARPTRADHLAVGRRLASVRRARGVTQVDLGRALGRPQSHVAKLETGAVRLRFVEAVALSRLLEVPLGTLDPNADLIVPRRGDSTVQ